ncbi:Nematode fatty acid retinoid binding family-containing protein [Strongyloides ratti]|uniref:Nematode fatty acid retinoid binding family-containing protein n=1 Tax=Strongyloides ratti TaxID=34506 RepID=A0A090MS21_STRRB|nr:Nematode fatty acid retinoid binding family-containing protein [Strongyloides ratti]CEF61053.1 Nematode fatty acid retinoid binding family-containing protein [Strongyloides ratti]
MFLKISIILCLINIIISLNNVFGWSKEKTYDQIVYDFKVAFPREMQEFRNNLSIHELDILHKIESEKRKYKNVEELTETIKSASPVFQSKFKKLYSDLQQKINLLSVESLSFIYDIGGKVQHLIDSQIVFSKIQPSSELKNEYILKYKKLSQETKNNLQKVLPMYDHLYKLMLKSN